MMRIGFIIYGSLDTLTGGYLYDRIVVQGLRKLGHQVEVISLPSGPYLPSLALNFSPGLCRRMLAGRFDVIIEDELCHPSLFLLNRRLRPPAGPVRLALVHHIRCDEPRPRWKNLLLSVAERSFLSSVDGFILNSQTTRRTVMSLVNHPRPQVIAYPAGNRMANPLSADALRARARRSGPLALLFLGIVIPRKGLLPLLEALAGVDRDLWRLTIVGGLEWDPAHAAHARQRVRQLGLSEAVRFMGVQEDGALAEILRTHHLFCMPYAYEGFGIAILEAMAFGLPAMGCRQGAAGETIRHGKNGFLLDEGDLAGLRSILIRLHGDREELERLSLAAQATYAGAPTWEQGVHTIERFVWQMKGLRDGEKVMVPAGSAMP
ncbi:MAG: glycosyltransferase family 4 protein [Desulfobacteraceae bacterium]|nr:glycosyltransferase family 4 protein [Desulfobacteraceae bacterium]